MRRPAINRILYVFAALVTGSSSGMASLSHAVEHARENAEANAAAHTHGDRLDPAFNTELLETEPSLHADHPHPELDSSPVKTRIAATVLAARPIPVGIDVHLRVTGSQHSRTDVLSGHRSTGPPPKLRAPPQA